MAYGGPGIYIYIFFYSTCIRAPAVYCSVDKVLRHGEIVSDEEKKLTFQFFFFFPPTCQKNKDFFSKCAQIMWNLTIFLTKINFPPYFLFFPPTLAKGRFYFLFFFLRQSKKKPCQNSSTKQYTADALSLIQSVLPIV